jgi:hypothetical protein
MINYQPPGGSVNVTTAPAVVNLGATQRLVAVVGLGPTTITITDEAVTRSSGSVGVDYLSVYPSSGVTVTQFSTTPGIVSGSLVGANRTAVGGAQQANTLFNPASASVATNGSITWPFNAGSVTGADIPANNSIYYATYTYNVPTSQYSPTIFSAPQTLYNTFGNENNTNGILSIAGSLVIGNGSPAVMIVQTTGSSFNQSNYFSAIDKLQTKTNIEYIVCVFPSGSVTKAQQEAVLAYAYTHVQTMNNNNKERGLISGSPSNFTASDGINTAASDTGIGDTSTPGTYLYRANSLNNSNMIYVVPSLCTRVNQAGSTMNLDANFLAAAVGGLHLGQPHLANPINGFVISGLTIADDMWNSFQKNQLGGGGCLVMESTAGQMTVRDGITTNPASVFTTEMTVVSQIRLVKRTLRNLLKSTYTQGTGKVIDSTTTISVENTVFTGLNGLVTSKDIAAVGQTYNPLTGEVPITAVVDAVDPRQVDITCSFQPLYPFKYFVVNLSVSL